ncbi:MAG: phosphoglycerate dehydrogenase [Rhodospirillales bacterium]|nr:phosphoglycerate dehydrogenase [Rhodospirillales bacterium]
MVKVLISDKMSPLAEQVFKNRGIEVDVITGQSPEQLAAIIGDYEGLAIRSSTKAVGDIIARAGKLKVIGRAGIGVDNVDIPAATQKGIVVMNTPFGNSITTAEHAIAMMLALARDIPQANASTHAGKWEKSRFMGIEITGKTVGVIGCGNIGSIFADRALGLKMKVIGYDPYLTPERAQALGIEKVELNELLGRADFITLHTPLTDATKNIICAKNIKKMKDGVRLINCARGGLVVEADLKAGLESGKIAGAGLDVLSVEPATEHMFFGMENVILTPHLGASTTEAQEKVAEQVAEQMADYLLTGAVTNALNMPSVSAEEAPRLTPYMKLAGQLGSFAGQATQTAYQEVTIEYEGAVAELNVKPLTAAVLQGLLAPLMEGVNMVSAPVIARERDIIISEVTREKGEAYQTLIRLTVKTENQTRSVCGTLFNGTEPRLVEVKGIPIDARIGPNMLYITNRDKPGFIGSLGTVLGDAGVNIATFSLGRASEGGDAIALIEIDGEPGKDVIDRVCELEHVVMVKAMRF